MHALVPPNILNLFVIIPRFSANIVRCDLLQTKFSDVLIMLQHMIYVQTFIAQVLKQMSR